MECPELTAAEEKVFALRRTKRKLRYFCKSCEGDIDQTEVKATLMNLNNTMENLKSSNEKLVSEIHE